MLRTGIFCVIGLASVASLAQGANRVGAPVALRAGDELINVDIGHAAPFVGDIDNDGQIDLLVGQFGGGKLRIHRGLGEGQFASMEWFQAAGQEANVPAGWCVGFGPQLVDYDGDGHNDILSGCFPGHLYLFHRQADGSFAEKEQILDADGKPIKQGSASTVFATDWDDDQDLDLIVGDIEGFVWLIKNQGTRHQPAYGNAQKLTAPHKAGEADSDDDADKDQDETDDDQPHENEPIQVAGGDSGPVVADWDQDGLMDLVVGAGDGSILLYRNAGTKIEPKLAAVEVLVPASRPMKSWADAEERREEGGPADGPVRGIRAKVCVTDWNGDRRPDLLVGDFIRRALPPRKLSDDERAKKKEADQAFAEVLERYQEAIAKFTESLQAQQSEADAETESTDDAEDEKNDDTDATDEVEFEIDFDQFAKENPQLMEEFQRAAEERQKYEEEGRTEMGGHVWVYLGVDGP